MNGVNEFSEAVLRLASTVAEGYERRLDSAGLRATSELRDWSEREFSSVELRVDFWRGDNLIDFFEDFVIKQGEPVGSIQQIEEWLRNGFDAALRDSPPVSL